jgi:hypothetical protein
VNLEYGSLLNGIIESHGAFEADIVNDRETDCPLLFLAPGQWGLQMENFKLLS